MYSLFTSALFAAAIIAGIVLLLILAEYADRRWRFGNYVFFGALFWIILTAIFWLLGNGL